jgi:hypothetical protein
MTPTVKTETATMTIQGQLTWLLDTDVAPQASKPHPDAKDQARSQNREFASPV